MDEYGPPTWRRLVQAIDSAAGGNDHNLAVRIALQHPVGKYCVEVTNNYFMLLLSLGGQNVVIEETKDQREGGNIIIVYGGPEGPCPLA